MWACPISCWAPRPMCSAIWRYGGWGTPQSLIYLEMGISSNYKPSILGISHFRKPPYGGYSIRKRVWQDIARWYICEWTSDVGCTSKWVGFETCKWTQLYLHCDSMYFWDETNDWFCVDKSWVLLLLCLSTCVLDPDVVACVCPLRLVKEWGRVKNGQHPCASTCQHFGVKVVPRFLWIATCMP